MFGGFPPVFDEAQLSRIPQHLDPGERLQILRISYASP
jgi:hypothetical protein